jgi:hypothetical protein
MIPQPNSSAGKMRIARDRAVVNTVMKLVATGSFESLADTI